MSESLEVQIAEVIRTADDLRVAVDREQETRARQISESRLAITVAIVAAVLGGVLNFVLVLKVWGQADELAALQQERAVADCQRGNASTATIVAAFEQYTQALVSSSKVPDDPAARAAFEQRVASFRADLAARLASLGPRDCSPEAVNAAAKG